MSTLLKIFSELSSILSENAQYFLLFILLVIVVFVFLLIYLEKITIVSIRPLKITSPSVIKELQETREKLNKYNEYINKQDKRIKKLEVHLEQETPITVTSLRNKYFIGIDIGRNQIDYCLLEYEKFTQRNFNQCKIIEGTKNSHNNNYDEIFTIVLDIITEIYKNITLRNINPVAIEGIGLALPGQVDPRSGTLIHAPGIANSRERKIGEELLNPLISNIGSNNIAQPLQIRIDNDVRCATRYLYRTKTINDAICIFSGRGLGSGIILNKNLIYGHNFIAGEIGHTTISECSELLQTPLCPINKIEIYLKTRLVHKLGGSKNVLEEIKNLKKHPILGLKVCNCEKKGCHWEMFAARDGMLDIAKKLIPEKYNELNDNYNEIIDNNNYKELLENDFFREHKNKHKDGDDLTTYFFSLAYYAGDNYAKSVVKKFFEYFAIGIANYANIINPEEVYLGGGMVKGFLNPPSGIVGPSNLQADLRTMVELYSLSDHIIINTLPDEETQMVSIGASLIFKDDSYFKYITRT